MKRNIWAVLLVCASVTLVSLDADARRIGGGKSFGRQSNNVTQREAATPNTPAAPAQNAAPGSGATNSAASNAAARPGAAAAGAAQAAKRPWAGILGGIAAGLGLAWLANALGLGPAFANILLIALLAMAGLALWRMFAARGNLAMQGAGGPAGARLPRQYSPRNVGNDASARPWEHQGAAFDGSAPASSGTALGGSGGGVSIGSALSGAQGWGVPAGFDADGFLAAAKRNFVTLQDAWDRADVRTLRSMMTDGMVEE